MSAVMECVEEQVQETTMHVKVTHGGTFFATGLKPEGARVKVDLRSVEINAERALLAIGKAPAELDPDSALDACALLARLGFAAKSQPYFDVAAHPRTGNFTRAALLGIATGSIRQLAAYIDIARDMGTCGIDANGINAVKIAVELMDRDNTSDAELAAWMDLMGETLRADGCLVCDAIDFEVFNMPGVMEKVCVQHQSDSTDVDHVVDLELAFVDRMIAQGVFTSPMVHISVGAREK